MRSKPDILSSIMKDREDQGHYQNKKKKGQLSDAASENSEELFLSVGSSRNSEVLQSEISDDQKVRSCVNDIS